MRTAIYALVATAALAPSWAMAGEWATQALETADKIVTQFKVKQVISKGDESLRNAMYGSLLLLQVQRNEVTLELEENEKAALHAVALIRAEAANLRMVDPNLSIYSDEQLLALMDLVYERSGSSSPPIFHRGDNGSIVVPGQTSLLDLIGEKKRIQYRLRNIKLTIKDVEKAIATLSKS